MLTCLTLQFLTSAFLMAPALPLEFSLDDTYAVLGMGSRYNFGFEVLKGQFRGLSPRGHTGTGPWTVNDYWLAGATLSTKMWGRAGRQQEPPSSCFYPQALPLLCILQVFPASVGDLEEHILELIEITREAVGKEPSLKKWCFNTRVTKAMRKHIHLLIGLKVKQKGQELLTFHMESRLNNQGVWTPANHLPSLEPAEKLDKKQSLARQQWNSFPKHNLSAKASFCSLVVDSKAHLPGPSLNAQLVLPLAATLWSKLQVSMKTENHPCTIVPHKYNPQAPVSLKIHFSCQARAPALQALTPIILHPSSQGLSASQSKGKSGSKPVCASVQAHWTAHSPPLLTLHRTSVIQE